MNVRGGTVMDLPQKNSLTNFIHVLHASAGGRGYSKWQPQKAQSRPAKPVNYNIYTPRVQDNNRILHPVYETVYDSSKIESNTEAFLFSFGSREVGRH